jgi:hypothetical protein
VAYPQIAAFARLANGDVAPVRSIAGQATMISRADHDLQYNAATDEFVNANPEAQSVMTFRGGANGEEAPIRVIQGPHTQIGFPNHGIGLDNIHNELFIVDKEYVLVFPRTATGDVAPLRVIRGPNTMLLNARGVAVDPVRNVLLVGTDSGLLVFDRTANGDAKPRAIITGPMSGIRSRPPVNLKDLTEEQIEERRRGGQGVAIQNMRLSPKGYLVSVQGRVAVPQDQSTVAGPDGKGNANGLPAGITAWSIDDMMKISGKGDVPVAFVLSNPAGKMAGGSMALNPNNKEVILGGLHSLEMYSFPEIF